MFVRHHPHPPFKNITKIWLSPVLKNASGNGNDHMTVSIIDGAVALSVALGTGNLDTRINPKEVRFDDNAWHHVIVERHSAEVSYF